MNEVRIASPATMIMLIESNDLHIDHLRSIIPTEEDPTVRGALEKKQKMLEETSNSIFEVLTRNNV